MTDAAVPDIAITPEARAWVAGQREQRLREWHQRRTSRRVWRLDASVLAIAAVLLRLPMLLADRALVFDDGTFGASALAMRLVGRPVPGAGSGVPFRGVFSSQGPLFLPLVWVADVLGFRTLDAPRLLAVAAGVLLTIAVYACGRRLTARGGALLAAALVTTSGSVLWVTGPINADGPALALSVVAVACALRYRDDPRLVDAVLVGLAGGAALSIKLVAAPAVVVAGVVVVSSRATPPEVAPPARQKRRAGDAIPVRDGPVAAGVAVAVYLVAALPWGIGRVWDQSYTYHADVARQLSVADALVKVLRTLWERDLAVLVTLVLAGVVVILVRTRVVRRAPRSTPHRLAPEAVGVAIWALLVLALLLDEPALWRAHVAHLVVPLALLAALRPPPWRLLLVAAVVVVPVTVATRGDLWWPGGYDGHEQALIRYLQTSQPDAEFLSDDPGLVWRADRRIPSWFVDPSFQRIDDGDITTESIVDAWNYRVCGVIVTSPERYGRLKGLAEAIEARWTPTDLGPGPYPVPVPRRWVTVKHFGPHITVYALGDGSIRNCGGTPG